MSITENKNDIFFMNEALSLARQAFERNEVPVGAVVVRNGEIIGRGSNERECSCDATAHAEVLAIRDACEALGAWRLSDCVLYVTMEPCPMCAGAIVNSRIARVVYGCRDANAGCFGSVMNFSSYPFSHAFELTADVCRDECAAILAEFFKKKRNKK